MCFCCLEECLQVILVAVLAVEVIELPRHVTLHTSTRYTPERTASIHTAATNNIQMPSDAHVDIRAIAESMQAVNRRLHANLLLLGCTGETVDHAQETSSAGQRSSLNLKLLLWCTWLDTDWLGGGSQMCVQVRACITQARV